MKRPFVVGGAGFLGAHLVQRLLQMPSIERITVYDNLSSGRRPTSVDDRLHFIEAHVQDYDRLRTEMADHDYVFHLAANPDIARAATEPAIDFDNGTVLTKCVLEAMRVNGVRNLFFASGSGVYGEGVFNALEVDPILPISPYGASKAASEAMICAYAHMFGMTGRVLRFANIVGPLQTHGVGYDFIRKLRADPGRLQILGDGRQRKSYLHVADALNAIGVACGQSAPDMGAPSGPFAVFNAATRDSLTVTEIAQIVVSIMGLGPVTFDYAGGDRGWNGDVPTISFNCDRLRALGWRPDHDSRSAMCLAIEAML